jgi:16S rRNA (adenine1518-N6/adenine1519-N6)-dimethyltransferase
MLRAKKSLGQNFLINPGVLDKIVTAAELDKNDTVIEIGPGTGILTEKLAEKAGKIIAIEKDRRLIEGLRKKFFARDGSAFGGKNTNVEIVEADILKLDIGELFRNYKLLGEDSHAKPGISVEIRDSDYKVVGNIPYYITSHLLKTVFEEWPTPKLIILMIQKEVAQRIVAKPPHMNLLALSIQFYAEPKIASYVSRGSFRPMPKVDSAIISLRPKALSLKPEFKKEFFKLVRTAFAGKRKQLKNTIGLEVLNKAGIKPKARPEELSMEDWINLANHLLVDKRLRKSFIHKGA